MTATRQVIADDLPRLAGIHAAAFPDAPWDEAMLARLTAMPGALALAAAGDADGFILLRRAADEAEVITIAVSPAARRRGIGQGLLAAGLERVAADGVAVVFLEVAVDNDAAIALYRRAGFAETGRRRGYYRRADGTAADAVVMSRSLVDF